MALATDSKYKSRLLREMARDLNKTDHSCASSTGSHHGTVSDTSEDFDPNNPDDEVFQSTQHMDFDLSRRLPEIRDTAKKYGRWNGGRQPEFVINTSALGRAFPNFSQGGSDDSIDFEVSRGAKTRQRGEAQVQVPRAQYSDNLDSPAVTIGNVQILGTPPMGGQPRISKAQKAQDTGRSSSRKESHSKRVPSSQKANIPLPDASKLYDRMPGYVSGATISRNGEQRRTLTELHAKVADESDASYISEGRPPSLTFANKNSRFANFQPRNSPLAQTNSFKTQPVTDAAVDSLAYHRQALQEETPSRPPTSSNANTNTLNPTVQSFLLPNMPEISELVSVTVKEGSPVFTRGGKVQTRFSSAPTVGLPKEDHAFVDGIPVPGDEKAIFLSLELLQERVTALEMEKADSQITIEHLRGENYQLQAENRELKQRRRSDSALGDSGSDAEHARDNRKLIAEKTKLEAQLKSMQGRLDASERKAANQELRLKNNTVERDQAVKQLAEALYNAERLKSENGVLREENEALRQQLTEFLAETQETARDWEQKEADLLRKLQRREQAVREMQEMTREIQETQENIHFRTTSQTFESSSHRPSKSKGHKGAKIPEREIHERAEVMVHETSQGVQIANDQIGGRGRPSVVLNKTAHQAEPEESVRSRSRSQPRGIDNHEKRTVKLQKSYEGQYAQERTIDETSEDGSFDETTKTIHKDINLNKNDADSTHGSNYSSILGHGEMDRIRQILANEKAKQQDRLAASASAQVEDDTVCSVRSVRSARSVHSAPEDGSTLQRKPSKKGPTSILKNSGEGQDEMTGRLSVQSDVQASKGKDQTVQSSAFHQRRHSEESITDRASRCRVVNEEMTSAFILPDITLRGSHSAEHPVLSAAARRVLDGLAQHDGHNCTVCSRVASFETTNSTKKLQIKQSIRIEKPTPVSERMPVPVPYEDEPTLRPSVPPGLALVTVLKGLEDELAHLKMEHTQVQAMYNKHDASLGMRKRKNLKSKLEGLLKAMDTKADQIYSLYDVLEGQKQNGQELSEKDVEITLQSIGIDVDTLKETHVSGGNNHDAENESDEDSELDLPWEGIEDTTGSGSNKGKRQSSRV